MRCTAINFLPGGRIPGRKTDPFHKNKREISGPKTSFSGIGSPKSAGVCRRPRPRTKSTATGFPRGAGVCRPRRPRTRGSATGSRPAVRPAGRADRSAVFSFFEGAFFRRKGRRQQGGRSFSVDFLFRRMVPSAGGVRPVKRRPAPDLSCPGRACRPNGANFYQGGILMYDRPCGGGYRPPPPPPPKPKPEPAPWPQPPFPPCQSWPDPDFPCGSWPPCGPYTGQWACCSAPCQPCAPCFCGSPAFYLACGCLLCCLCRR